MLINVLGGISGLEVFLTARCQLQTLSGGRD